MDDNKIYLNYGDAKIEQDAFLKAAADSVESYLLMQPWSNSRKNLFREAYSDLMSRGILGASNSTGTWKVLYGNDPIDIASKSKKLKEMYGEAAYFIQQLMQGLASQDIAKKREEEEKKSTVPVFSNSEFISQLESQIGFNKFGGLPEWYQTQWTDLDNNNRGIYETVERQRILADLLQEFADNALKNPEKFNFEGSPFKDMSDFLARISKAIRGLRGNTSLDRETINALNELGINPLKYFYTGANRMVTFDGKQMTLLEYNDLMDQLQKESLLQLNLPQTQTEDIDIPDVELTDEQLEDLKRTKADQRKLSNGLKFEDYARMTAMALDLVASIAAFDPGYGTAASGILGLTSLGTNLAADIADESLTNWDRAKNIGINLGLGVVGMVPGLGAAGKGTKWLAQLAKWTPRILTMAAAGQIALSDDIQNSLKKATKVNEWGELTNHDVKNIAYALSTVSGISRLGNGIFNSRKFGAASKGTTKTEEYITTKSGKKVKVTKELVEKINKAGKKGGTQKANEELQKIPGAEHEEVNVEFKTGKFSISPKVKSTSEMVSVDAPPRVRAYQRKLRMQNASLKAKHPTLSRFLPTNYDIYVGARNLLFPRLNIVERVKQAWNPISEGKFKHSDTPPSSIGGAASAAGSSSSAGTSVSGSSSSSASSSSSTGASSSTGSSTTGRRTWEEISREGSKWKMSDTAKEYRKLSAEHSGNKLSLKAYKIGNGKINSFQVKKLPTASDPGILKIRINGKKESISFRNQEELRVKVLELLRNNKIKTSTPAGATKLDSEATGKFLRGLALRGVLKQGGTIDKQKIQRYKEFIKK